MGFWVEADGVGDTLKKFRYAMFFSELSSGLISEWMLILKPSIG